MICVLIMAESESLPGAPERERWLTGGNSPERGAVAVAQTAKCPYCGFLNDPAAKQCASTSCNSYLKSDLECLRSIEVSVRTIKRITIWWLILSIVGVVLGFLASVGAFR